MRIGKYILLLISLLFVLSCVKELESEFNGSERSSLVLTLDSSSALRLQTKTDNPLEGECFSNVLVILVDNSNNVVGTVYKEYPYDPSASGNDPDQDEILTSTTKQDIIRFDGLLPGDYNVYAYANIDATDWQNGGSDLITDSSKEKGLIGGSSFSTFVDRQLASMISATDAPANPATSMLLTGNKMIPVGLSTAAETIELKRPVVRFKVTVHNNTPYPVIVNDLHFSHFNPDKAYLLEHSVDGVPVPPTGVTYRSLPAYNTLSPVTVTSETETVVYSTLLYENVSPNAYKIYSTLTLDRHSVEPSLANPDPLIIGGSSFGPLTYERLSQMDEGESVDVMLINPQINVRSGRIFVNRTASKRLAWESAGYTSYKDFFNRAKAIYDEDASYDYSSRYAAYSDNNGYSAWDGIDGHAPKEDNTFSYTGARSQYFHSLTKSGGLYTFDGLAIGNPANATSIPNLRIEEGAVNKKDVIPQDMAGKLVRFINNSNSKYLRANTSDKTYTKLEFVDAGINQDRQFVLFGQYSLGGLMKRILKENNKSVPLTYMARNEEINVIINVYYADQSGVLNFVVDNSTWTTPTTSSHTFN